MEGKEILAVVDSVSSEKGLEKDVIFVAMELAIASASQRHFHEDAQLVVEVDRASGVFITKRQWEVLDESDEEFHRESHVSPSESSMDIGELYFKQVSNVEFGRIETQAARQVMLQKVREAEKELVVSKFQSSDNNLVSGFVKRVTRDNIIIDLGQDAEAILPRDQILPGEIFKINDRVRAVLQIKEIEGRGLQLMLSRICTEMVTELFRIEVPEVNEDVIEIRGVARDPGSRSKIAVKTNDGRIDPVGACVGMRGSRVQAVVNELQGEKIDIVNWSEDPAILVSNALSPAEVQRVNVDAERKKLDVILTEENLSKAIGRRGQNVRLATKLLNYEINIMTDAEDSERRQSEFKEKTENFVKNLELDETLGQLLVAEGFSTIDDIKDSSAENLMKIEGIEEDTAKALIERAQEFHQKDQEDISTRIKELGLEDTLINLKGLTPGMLVTLGEQKILTLEDFADLASDELTGGFDVVKGERVKIQGYLEDFALSKEEADELIMSARNIVYKD